MRVPSLAGVILSGGRSSRFGTNKAAADLNGQSLIGRVYDTLAQTCSPIAAAGDPAGLDMAAGLADPPGSPAGPLSGILAGLLWARANGSLRLATAPCDAPFLPADFPSRLVEAMTTNDAPIAVCRSVNGLEPLCAVWSIGMIEKLERALLNGHPPVHRFLSEAGAAAVLFDHATSFLNVNTPEDLKRAESLLAQDR